MTGTRHAADDFEVPSDLYAIDQALGALSAQPKESFRGQLDALLRQSAWATINERMVPITSQRAHIPHRYRRPVVHCVAAVIVVALVAATAGVVWRARPQSVSAQAILEKASAPVSGSLSATGIRTYHFKVSSAVQVTLANGQQDVITSTAESWGALPDRWRAETTTHTTLGGASTFANGSDGTIEWSYEDQGQRREAHIGMLSPGEMTPIPQPIRLSGVTMTPGAAVDVGQCYRQAKMADDATIAGRQAYAIVLGPNSCSQGAIIDRSGTAIPSTIVPPSLQGRAMVWIDKRTLFFLKQEIDNIDGTVKELSEVTQLDENPQVVDSLFAFVPPAGATIVDQRPGPYRSQGAAT